MGKSRDESESVNKNHSFARFSLALRSPQLQFGGDPGECWDQLEESDAIPQKSGSQEESGEAGP
jgi:hypothetical protein